VSTVLTKDHIVAAVDALPIQGRIMLRLLLLRYLDIAPEDIQYMATDRPDPRFQSGGKPIIPYISQETLQGITNRAEHYRSLARQKRERLKLQIDCLDRLLARNEALIELASTLLTTRFAMSPEAVAEVRTLSRTAVPKPVLRELDRNGNSTKSRKRTIAKNGSALNCNASCVASSPIASAWRKPNESSMRPIRHRSKTTRSAISGGSRPAACLPARPNT